MKRLSPKKILKKKLKYHLSVSIQDIFDSIFSKMRILRNILYNELNEMFQCF
jgi:hypothetical protein